MEKFGLVLVVVILSVVWRISGQRQCSRLQKPWNGEFVGNCNRNVGAECLFQCREPYVLVGSRVRTCRNDGSWSGQTTACELDGCADCGGGGNSNCANIYNPENGYTEGQCTPGLIGQTCRFQCYQGYSLDGQTNLVCRNGQWSSTAPACRRRSAAICEYIVVQNGYSSCAEQGGLTVCSVTCEDGYIIVGSSVVTCSSSGDWNDVTPYCRSTGTQVSNVCPTLYTPDGGRLVGSCTSAGTGDTCQLACLSGYRPTDTRVLICQTNGQWSDSLPRCLGDTSGCPRISVLYGSTSVACSSSRTGQSCVITCDSGYTLTGGSGTLVCQSNGQWSGNTPTCTVQQSCPILPAPASGSYSGTCSPGQVGQSCTFYCNSGYQLVGQSTLVCGNDGRWSGNPPYCSSATCPSLDTPSYGARSGTCTQATVGQSCSFSCQAGYVLTGQSTLYCQAGGVWSSSAPTCNRVASTCPYLSAPSNGFTNGACSQASVGQTCTFSCQSGYTLSGQATLYCQSGRQWSSSAPYCIRSTLETGNCPVLTAPPNGQFLRCDNRSGGQCIVVCERGYTRSGSRVRTCLSQGTWSGYAPTCTRTVGYTTYTYRVVPLWSLVFG